jgi:hypothetical protein
MATYYWVGGSGTWDDTSTTNWSLTSGGSGGAGVPTASDAVQFTSASGSGTVSVVWGAICASFLYDSDALVTFGGSAEGIEVRGSFQMLASRTFTVGTLYFRYTSSSAVFLCLSTLQDLTMVAYTGSTVTVDLQSDITCSDFYNSAVSMTLNASSYSIDCASCRFEGGSETYQKKVGEAGKTLDINITPAGSTAFYCNWTYSTDEFVGVSVLVSAGYSGTYVSTSLQASYQTSFNLTLDGGTVNLEPSGGVNNISLINGASATVRTGSLPVLGNFSMDATSILAGSSRYMDIRKKTGSSNVSRTFAVTSGGQWRELGLRNFVAAATDTISITGVYGAAAYALFEFNPGVATVGAGPVHAFSSQLATGGTFSSTELYVYGLFNIVSGASLSGTYTVYAVGTSITPNGGLIPNLVIPSSSVSLVNNLAVTNLTFSPTLGDGTASLTVASGATITVASTLSMTGLSETDNIVFQASSTSAFNVIKTSGRVDATYATITNSNASGGARFNAYTRNGNIDGGGNSGWKFTSGSGFFLVLRR